MENEVRVAVIPQDTIDTNTDPHRSPFLKHMDRNYKQEYKNAFGRARSAYGTGAYDDSTMEFIFPQIAESEDERTRKFLLRLAERCNENSIDFMGEIKKKDVIAYLEKQKEQKPEVKDPFDDEQFRRGYEAGKKEQHHWKPSEEQMWALDVALENFYNQNDRAALESLYNDLKKL